MYNGMYYYDVTYILVIIGMLLCLGASAHVKSVMNRYSRVRSSVGMTGAEVARQILNREGLYHVQVQCLQANEGDHYDPRTNTVNLSAANFNGTSVTAVGVAAHECGHAIQHSQGYTPLTIRSSLVPVVNIGSKVGVPLIILGVILSMNMVLIQIGIWAFALSVLFQVITLPVEFNASRRAVEKIESYGFLSTEETVGCKKVLSAAAMTYVAAAASSALQLLRLILLYGGGNRRRD